MKTAGWMLAIICLLSPAPLASQELLPEPANAGPVLELAQADPDAAHRQAILDVLGRTEVRRSARLAGLDMDRAEAAVMGLEGELLARAARQAKEVDRRLAINGAISTTTIIILLLIAILIVVAVN